MQSGIPELAFTNVAYVGRKTTQRHIISAFTLSPQVNLRGNVKSRENWCLLLNEASDHAYQSKL